MAIHELATNAAKYGAFSVGNGKVSLSWMRLDDGDEDRVVFRWVETGGPKVAQMQKSGFGSQLIRSTITGSLHGSVDMDWRDDGLVCEISVPHKELSELKDDIVYDFL